MHPTRDRRDRHHPSTSWPITRRLVLAVPAILIAVGGSSSAQDGFIPHTSTSSTAFSVGDSTGHVWRVRRAGYVNSSSGAFGTVGTAMLAGSSLSFTNPMSKPNESELRITANWNNVRITRRIRIDRAAGTCRFVDSFTNTGTSTVRADFTVRHDLSAVAQTVMTDQQRTINQGTTSLRPDETGFVAWRPGGGNLRSLVCFTGTVTPTLAPKITNTSQSTFTLTYPLQLEPKATWTLVHGLAAPAIPNAPNKTSLVAPFAPFRSAKWIVDLPIATRRTIVNSASSVALASELESVLAPLARFCAERSIARSDVALLVVDDETRLRGSVEGEGIVIDTDLGQTKIPLAEIAAFAGKRAGIEPRVFLRTGDVLVGTIVDCPLTFRTREGTTIGLEPERLASLVMARAEADGRIADDARGLAVLASGQRITGRLAADTRWKVVTPWGPADLPAGRVRKYDTRREPQPLVRLDFADGCRLHVLVLAREFDLEATRFGALRFPSSELDEWQVVASPMDSASPADGRTAAAEAPEPPGDDSKEPDARDEDPLPADDGPDDTKPMPSPPAEEEPGKGWKATDTPNLPHLDLIGENVLVGTIVESKLRIRTSAGEFEIETARIRRMENKSTPNRPSPRFEVEVGEEKLIGSLVDGALTFRALDREWRIPAAHLRGYDSQPTLPKPPASKKTVVAPPVRSPPAPTRVFESF